ncbi:MAG: hypothetical protein M1838_002316 [Thelocarpon superellum]|nr:MAG: hypothetical protein M1838_002316 [Thelocarpon superellum]
MMNGNGFRGPDRNGTPSRYAAAAPTPAPAQPAMPSSPPPPTRVLLDGYQDAYRTPQEDRARYNPFNKNRPRSSALLNVNDPVAMHLLVETALGDGQDCEVLSYEEVDEMKKELSLLNNRIEASHRKLALESKVRDAAQSLGRLNKKGRGDGPDSPQRHRRSFLGHRKSDSSAEEEFLTSERKCEELAQELWRLEKRANDLQRRLLQHTAGILQMTHRGILKDDPNGAVQPPPLDGAAGGYPYSHARLSPPLHDEDVFDHRSLYRNIEHGSMDDPQTAELTQQVGEAEQQLERANGRLRDMIVKMNPQLRSSYQAPPSQQPNGATPRPGSTIRAHLAYLEESLATVDKQQSTAVVGMVQSEQSTKERVKGLNLQLRDVINQSGGSSRGPLPTPPSSDQPLPAHLAYLKDTVAVVEQQLSAASQNSEHQVKADQYETVLYGLWEIILSGEEEARARKRQQRQARVMNPDPRGDDSDLSPDEEPIPNEQYSLQAFSAKIQWLYARATSMREQKAILRRQIKQQRQLNSKSDAARDGRATELERELERSAQSLDESHREAMNARQELSLVMQRLETARRDWTQREKLRSEDDSNAVNQLKQSQEELRRVQAALDQTRNEQGQHGAKIQSLERDLQSAHQARDNESQLREALDDKTRQLQDTQKEMESLEGELVRLQTEVTVARAELDGAYGTRAQRAAEVAANPAMQKELEELGSRNASLAAEVAALKSAHDAVGSGSSDLQRRVQTLQQELSDTITDYEAMTKQIIEFEKERESLESTVDGLRDRCETLEAELSDERVKWMGIKSPGVDGVDVGGPPAQSTSTTVLKNEFKKMMRDTRAENVKALRAEQEERRRLESLVRSLRKEQSANSPGRSNLNQSIKA